MIIADECVNRKLVTALREVGYEVNYILEVDSGIPDIEVLKTSEKLKGVLITEDSDFGEWVFAHKITSVTIIFLRYEKEDFEIIKKFLLESLKEIQEIEYTQFITINKNKVRYRRI
jgi:predicted nuclease of predicted toxin-antitoxin system